MIILECDQNTPEWDMARLGIPTASRFKDIITTKGERAKPRKKYLYDLVGEVISGEKKRGYYGSSMAKGHERENESREVYSFANEVEIKQVGFCYYDESKSFGCSPDGLIGEEGGFETKNAEPHIQAERIDAGWSENTHFQQVQGSLLVTGCKWWDLVSYSRGFRPIVIRFRRDDEFIKLLHAEINIFNKDLENLIKEVKGE